jgi:hypothetical protein
MQFIVMGIIFASLMLKLEENMIKQIVIGLPLYQLSDLRTMTQKCLQKVNEYNNQKEKEYEFDIRQVTGTSSLFARNYCASNMQEQTKQKIPYDYYLSIDGDMAFSVDSIIRLVEKYEDIKGEGKNIGIIGAAYAGRGNENADKIVAGNFCEVPGIAPSNLWLPYSCIECKEVDWVGTGFMLIPKDVFEALPYPWFRSYVVSKDNLSSLTTEDLSICMDVKQKLNRSIWVDASNRIAHIPH